MNCIILQAGIGAEKYRFTSWDYAKDMFDLRDYEVVYACPCPMESDDDYEVLESVFYKFNMNIPDDYSGHSLSISDVILLNGHCYYCNTFGFINIDEVVFGG